MGVARGTLAEVATLPLEEAVRKLVAVAIRAHRVDPKLHRVLAEQIPRTGRLKNVEAFNRENFALFRTCLEGHRDEIRDVDLDLAAFVCVTSGGGADTFGGLAPSGDALGRGNRGAQRRGYTARGGLFAIVFAVDVDGDPVRVVQPVTDYHLEKAGRTVGRDESRIATVQ